MGHIEDTRTREGLLSTKRVWRACLSTFGWTHERIDKYIYDHRWMLDPDGAGGTTLHEHALYYIAGLLVPRDLMERAGSGWTKLVWDVEHVIETPDGVKFDPFRQYDDDFDWQSARRRVDDFLDRIRRSELQPGEWTEKLIATARKQAAPQVE